MGGRCNAAGPIATMDSEFAGPQALAQAYRFTADTRDQGREARLPLLDGHHGAWRCEIAGSCSAVCPKGVDPALGIQLLKRTLLSRRFGPE
ncbi:MAG: succinate dehydrogenase iron-sulfur subunit, partial [Candidatus Thermoplasmatota archaeon]